MATDDKAPGDERSDGAVADAAGLGAAIRAARRLRGLTQAQLAASAGVSRQWVVAVEQGHDRAEIGKVMALLQATGLRLDPTLASSQRAHAPRSWLTAAEAAGAIGAEVARDDTNFGLRILGRALDEFRRLEDPRDLELFLRTPGTTGDHRWDVLLAAAVGRACRERDLPAPGWTNVRPLTPWWFPVFDPLLAARTMQRTPIDFAARGIWLDRKALEVA